MKHHTLRAIGILAALLFISWLILWERAPSQPSAIEKPEDYQAVQPRPADPLIDREASTASLSRTDGMPSVLVGRLRTNSGTPVGDGSLAFPQNDLLIEVQVTQGNIFACSEIGPLVSALSANIAGVWFQHSSGTWNPLLHFLPGSGEGPFEVIVAEPKILQLQTVDLRDDPVSEVMVSFFAALPTPKVKAGRTDGAGNLQLTFFSEDGSYQYQARKPGYMLEYGVVNIFESPPLKLRLRRILAAGLITDQRSPSIMHQLSMPVELKGIPGVNAYQYREILDPVVRRAALAPSEEVFWLVASEGSEWVQPSAAAAARDGDRRTFGPIMIPMLMITDPKLKLYRTTLDTYKDHTAILDLEIVTTMPIPDENWLPRIALSVLGTPTNPNVLLFKTYFGRLANPGRYRLYLPPGTYSIATVRDQNLFAGGAAPSIEDTPAFTLIEGENAPIQLRLKSDHQLIEIAFFNSNGMPTAIQAAIVPEEAPELSPNDHGARLVRYLRHGVPYKLIASRIDTKQSPILMHNLLLPVEAMTSGRWRLVVPDRDPESGSSHWLR